MPELYREAYELVVDRHMLDRDRRTCLTSLVQLSLDPRTLDYDGFPFWPGAWEPPEAPLEAALAEYRKRVQKGIERWTLPIRGPSPFPPDVIPSVIQACEELKAGRAVLDEIAEYLQLYTWTGVVATEALLEVERRAG